MALTSTTVIREQTGDRVTDCDAVDQQTLNRKVLHLRPRFRSKYLQQLKLTSHKNFIRSVALRKIALIRNNTNK